MKKKLISLILSLFVFASFYINIFNREINVFHLFLFVFIYIVLLKQNYTYQSIKHKKLNYFLAVFIALIYNIGYWVDNANSIENFKFFKYFFSIANIMSFIGLAIILYIILYYVYKIILKNNINKKAEVKISNKKLFWICFCLLLLFWTPYLLHYLPGIWGNDAIDQLWQALGVNSLNNHHPVTYTLFIRIFYKFGSLFFKTDLLRLTFVVIIQMIICSLIYSTVIVFIKKLGANKYIIIGTFIYYALNPIICMFAITIYKDTIFGSLILLLVLFLYKKLSGIKYKVFDYILYAILLIFIMLFRNNAMYAIILLLIYLIITFKDNEYLVLSTFVSLVIYLIIINPIFTAFYINKSSIAESVGIPIQQIARVVVNDGNLSKKEKSYISSIMPIEDIKQNYDPTTVDTLKFNGSFNSSIIQNDLFKFIKVWLVIGLKNPSLYIESYLYSTIGFWYPNHDVAYLLTTSTENDYFVQKDLFNGKVDTYFNVTQNKYLPGVYALWSVGMYVLVLFISLIYSIIKNGYKVILLYLPFVALWLTMMIATPVQGDIRYVYYLYCGLPLLLVLPFIKIRH